MAVPLFVRDEIAGAVYLSRVEPFAEADFAMITAISQIASIAIENAFHLERLLSEVVELKEALGIEDELRGGSRLMSELRSRISRVAQSEATVLITGESGRARNRWRVRSIATAAGRPNRSSPSIARHWRNNCSKANYSDMRKARSQAL